MILKFEGVKGHQLSQLQKYADRTYRSWNPSQGGSSQTHRVVTIKKTSVRDYHGETTWVVELDISERSPAQFGRYEDTTRDVVGFVLDILDCFPRKAKPESIDGDTGGVRRLEAPICPKCDHLTEGTGILFRCPNCHEVITSSSHAAKPFDGSEAVVCPTCKEDGLRFNEAAGLMVCNSCGHKQK